MAFAETANLAVKLTLGGNFNSQLSKTRASLRGFDKDASRAYKAGGQIGTGIKRGAILAVAGIGALTALLAQSVKEGQEAANVQKIYAQAIKNSGKVSQDYVKILDEQQLALMNLAGVDDELIKSSQTRLIQMGLTGKQVAKATPLILDFAKATGIDLLTATKLFGKAAQGNVGALSRYGVQIDKAKAKVDPFGAAIDAMNTKFGGTTKALSGSLDTRLAAFKEGLANIREEAGMKLLPVLTRIVDVAGKELVPAFAKFIDRVLPDVEAGLNQFADLLSNGGAARGIQAITDALGPMVELVKVSAAPVKAIVGAFLKLPKEVQTVLVGAFAVNKLTGGLVTNVAGGLAESLLKAVAGGIKAPLVNVQGGVVNVGGGLPGGGAPGVGTPIAAVAGGSAVAGAATAALVAGAVAVPLASIAVQLANLKPVSEQTRPVTLAGKGASFTVAAPTVVAAIKGLAGPRGPATVTKGLVGPRGPQDAKTVAAIKASQAEASRKAAEIKAANIATASAARDGSVAGRGTTSAVYSGTSALVGAIGRQPTPIVNVKVNVTPAQVQRSYVIQYRYGPATGSSGRAAGARVS
jgi:hypothetical protein